jgi:hypothetical protein
MTNTSFRRVVTGHNSEGKAIILEDGAPPRVQRIGGEIGPTFYEIWNTACRIAFVLIDGQFTDGLS